MERVYSEPVSPHSARTTSPEKTRIETSAWTKALLLFLGSSVLYLIFRSPGLDEIDSVNFAMGVHHFNLWQHPEKLAEITKDAVAVYTDDPVVALPPHWYRVPLNAFTRSVIIYWKVHYLELYLIDRQNGR